MAVDTSEQDLQKILNWQYCVDSRYDRGPVLIECKFRVPLSKLRFKIDSDKLSSDSGTRKTTCNVSVLREQGKSTNVC